MTTRIIPLLLIVATGALAACGSTKTRPQQLRETVRVYNDNVRWKRFHAAARHIPQRQRDRWLHQAERAGKSMVIVDYEAIPVTIGDERAVIAVDLAYYRMPGVVVERARRKQVWVYKSGDWRLESERITAVPEPDATPAELPELLPVDGEPNPADADHAWDDSPAPTR